MSPDLHLTETFPRAPSYRQHTGRGGAGNIARPQPRVSSTKSDSHDSLPPPDRLNSSLIDPDLTNCVYPPPRGMSTSTSSSRPSQRQKGFSTGRGGFGNLHPASELAMFCFDEELERLNRTQSHMAPVYYIGRGGRGNFIADRSSSIADSQGSSTASSAASQSSQSSTGSESSKLKSKLEKIKSNFWWLR